ncbi:hypothetical protein ACP70R_007432 [Stipagrostis hirtigluma subsp. patula]
MIPEDISDDIRLCVNNTARAQMAFDIIARDTQHGHRANPLTFPKHFVIPLGGKS